MAFIDNVIRFRATLEGNGFSSLNSNLKKTHNTLSMIKGVFAGVFGFDFRSIVRDFAGNLIQSSKDLGAMQSRFYAITKDSRLANEELQWSFNLARNTATDIKSVADQYSIFFASAKKSMGTEATREIFQNWTEVSRVMHLQPEAFNRVMYAMRELTSKGAIYSQDLRMQIGTHIPDAMGLTKEAFDELGKTVSEVMGITGPDWFEKFQKKAKGNQKLINQWLLLFSRFAKMKYASPEALAKSLMQTDARIQKITNSWQEFLYKIVALPQFTKDLNFILDNAYNVIKYISENAEGIYNWTRKIVEALLLLEGSYVLRGIFGKGGAISGLGLIANKAKAFGNWLSSPIVLITGLFGAIWSFIQWTLPIWFENIVNFFIISLPELFTAISSAIGTFLTGLGGTILFWVLAVLSLIFTTIFTYFWIKTGDFKKAWQEFVNWMVNTLLYGVQDLFSKLTFGLYTPGYRKNMPNEGISIPNYKNLPNNNGTYMSPAKSNYNPTINQKNTITINGSNLTQEQMSSAIADANNRFLQQANNNAKRGVIHTNFMSPAPINSN